MAKPLDTLKKIKGKSRTEIRTDGEQEITVRSDQIGLSGKLPSDNEFAELVDKSFFGRENITAEDLFDKFFEDAEYNFSPSFRQKEQTLESFQKMFGEKSRQFFIDQAEKIVSGRFDLLGLQNLDFSAEVDWHFEPLMSKVSPRKPWKQFDEFSTEETGDKKIVWELNRHQHFFDLGVAFWLTNDERYAETFAAHLNNWLQENPPGIGINWFSSLKVALRSISWVWAFHFFKDSANFTPELFQKALKFIYLHGRHIEKYLSTYYSPNTHLTAKHSDFIISERSFRFSNKRKIGARRAKKFSLTNSTGKFLPTAFILNSQLGISVTRRIFTRISIS